MDTLRQFNELIGQTLTRASVCPDHERIVFETSGGKTYVLAHSQDCCESVTVEDVIGDLSDLTQSPILVAEEVAHVNENPEGVPDKGDPESFTWTFYKLATSKGSVTIRFFGESNGYYSEGVDFIEV